MNGINQGIESRTRAFSESLTQKALDLAKSLGDGGGDLLRALDEKTQFIGTGLATRATEISEVIAAKTEELHTLLEDRSSAISEALAEKVGQFEVQVVNRLATMSGELNETGRALAESLAARAGEIEETLGRHTAHLHAALDHETGQFEQILTGHSTDIRETIAQALEDIDQTLAGRAGEIGDGLARKINEVSLTLADRLVSLEGALGEKGHALQTALAARSGDLRELLVTRGEGLVEALGRLSQQIAEQVVGVGETTRQSVEDRANSAVQHLDEKQKEFVSAVEQSAAHLRGVIETGATTSIEALVETNERLRNGMADMIARLTETSETLGQALSTTDQDFTAVEQALGSRMADFRTILSQLTGEIGELNSTTRATLGEAGSLAERIAEHRQSLAGSAGELLQQQGDLTQIFATRQAAFEALVTGMSERREELESFMHGFAEKIDEAFAKAATRAQEIGTLLDETSRSTSGLIDQQFAGLRSHIESERDNIGAALIATSEHTNVEIARILEETTQRFQTAAMELRDMAHEINREVEATHETLRRSIFELPQETAQQAAAMRRSVADQIKALEELSEIVTRSGRALDVSQPAQASTPRITSHVAARRVEPRRVVESLQGLERQRTEPTPSSPHLTAVQTSSKTTERGTGWLSDLLARVDHGEAAMPTPPTGATSSAPYTVAQTPTPKPAQSGQRLEAMSLDVAQMIDHSAVSAAWERYRAGDKNAFQKRIYVGRGPQTFEEIRRRYRADPEFRTTVDRYVTEFERLLSGLNADVNGDAVARTYLLSETGKVYTLLAHAAGKLGA